MTRSEFLERALSEAQKAYQQKSTFNPVIAAAQAALESNWGQSRLATEANNLKGVKAGSRWQGPTIDMQTREWREADNTWYTTVARWRRYDTWADAFVDYAKDIIERNYPHAVAVKDDPKQFLIALTSGRLKYATDPHYTDKVWSIVQQFGLLEKASPPERAQFRLEVYTASGVLLFATEQLGVASINNEPLTGEGGKLQIRFGGG